MQYIQESQNDFSSEEFIDEGLKDWIKKVAISTAVAASCLNLNAAPIERVYSFNDDDPNTEIVQKKKNERVVCFTKIENEDGTLTFEGTKSHSKQLALTQAKAMIEVLKDIYGEREGLRIADAKCLYSRAEQRYMYTVTFRPDASIK